MNSYLVIEFSNQKWAIPLSYVVRVTNLPKGVSSPDSLPDQITMCDRAVPMIDPASLLGMVWVTSTVPKISQAVVISRGHIWLALAVSQVFSVQSLETNDGRWLGSYVPIGVRRDLVQAVGVTIDGHPVLILDAEKFISVWQEQAPHEAFPLPKGPRLGEKTLSNQEKRFYSGPERRSHLRLEKTEQVLIQKSRQSGYPAYRTIISFQKNLKEDSLQLTRVIKLLQELGTVIGAEAIYKPETLGKFGRHLGLLYLTDYPPETILDRLHEIEEVDKAQLVSFSLVKS